jgi:hypothetical protein
MSIDVSDPGNLPSERNFGFFFAAVFLAGAAYFYVTGATTAWVLGSFLPGILLLAAAVLRPRLLSRLNEAWFRLGILLARFVSPVILGAIFFLILTPVGLFTRLLGRDELRLRAHPGARSYWIDRKPVGPVASSFKNQF